MRKFIKSALIILCAASLLTLVSTRAFAGQKETYSSIYQQCVKDAADKHPALGLIALFGCFFYIPAKAMAACGNDSGVEAPQIDEAVLDTILNMNVDDSAKQEMLKNYMNNAYGPALNEWYEENCNNDSDADGIDDFIDNCVDTPNADQDDADKDKIGNACDDDDDSDGITDETDNCPEDANPGQEDSNDNGIGDACEDRDGDYIRDSKDNCPDDPNNDQKDSDGDGIGNVCDPIDNVADDDDDGIVNVDDNCPTVANPNQRDDDNDKIGNVCDNCTMFKNPEQTDTEAELCFDVDSDGIPAFVDNCEWQYDPTNECSVNPEGGDGSSKKGCNMSLMGNPDASLFPFLPLLFGLAVIAIRRRRLS